MGEFSAEVTFAVRHEGSIGAHHVAFVVTARPTDTNALRHYI